jgi:LCP family protein required for cell wall assembly
LAVPALLAVPYVALLLDRIDRVAVELPGSPGRGTTYLVIGTDSREFVSNPSEARAYGTSDSVPGARADLILAIRRPADGGAPQLLSVPRDLLVLDSELGLSRITLSYLDGAQGVVDALCNSLGIGVDHLVIVDFGGFVELIDDVGGIDVTLDRMLFDPRVSLWLFPGTRHLDGPTALRYVRARNLLELDGQTWVPHDPADDRSARARVVLEAFAARAGLSPLRPIESHRLLWSTAGVLTIDESATIFDVEGLGNALRSIGTAPEARLPVVSHSGSIPWAELQPGAAEALAPFTSKASTCQAALPTARSSGFPRPGG